MAGAEHRSSPALPSVGEGGAGSPCWVDLEDLEERHQCQELILEAANCLTVPDVAEDIFLRHDNPYVGVNSAGKGREDPQHGNLYEEEDNFGKHHGDLPHDNLYEVADNSEKLHDDLQHGNLYEEADISGKLHGALPHDNLYEGADNSEKHHDNQEVLETVMDDSWVALEASRHGSLEV